MRKTSSTKLTEAVLFFDGNKIIKEMLYSEFEALLDNIVSTPDFADCECEAVFVKINPQLKVLAAVFFIIPFDENGYVLPNWNLPLHHMSEMAGKGPDLGAGAIRLACRSQCPVSWHYRYMWDPIMSVQANNFVTIRDTVLRNRMGIVVEYPQEDLRLAEPPILQPMDVEIPVLRQTASQDVESDKAVRQSEAFRKKERDKAARLIKQLRLQLATQNTRIKDELSVLAQTHAREIEAYQKKLQQTQQALKVQAGRNEQLKLSLSKQAADYELAREQFLDQIDEARELEKSQIDVLREKFQVELQSKIEAESAQLKEMLDMREVELYYRDEQIASLREEVAQLRQEKQALLNEGGDRFIENLGQSGITLVAYHPGVGHLTIPVADAGRYLDSPTAYVAEKCFVTQERYIEWLSHYQTPQCQHKNSAGSCCGKELARIDRPGHFVLGKSDRCEEHVVTAANFDSQTLKIG